MTFEGEHRQIVMRGIERAMANGIAQDGGMNEVINMIPRNGSFIPYGPTQVEQAYSSYINSSTKMVRVHHTSTGDNTIIVFENYYRIGSNGTVSETINKKVRNIVFIGNRMDLDTDDGIEHWLWKNGEYKNIDNIGVNSNDESPLPYVNFRVSRGIYDGKKVYKSARYVRIQKHYTDADSTKKAPGDASSYVENIGSMGTDAMALLDSIRYTGGITGYVLVAAAWRVKGSDISKPKYIMASPVMLMGTPEIFIKDDEFERFRDDVEIPREYISKPEKFMLEMYQDGHIWNDTAIYHGLMDIKDSDDRDVDNIAEGEHVGIELFDEEKDRCDLHNSISDSTTEIFPPALWANKIAAWNSDDDEHRGIRITHGSGNYLEYRLSADVLEEYKDEIDRLCIFVSPVISPYKRIDTMGVRMKFNDKKEKVEGYSPSVVQEGQDPFIIFGDTWLGSFMPDLKSDAEIREEIKNVVGLYKMAEYHLNELEDGEWIKVNLSDGRLETDKMVQKSDTMLKLSDLQPVKFQKGHIFGYNERLHVFNFQKSEIYRLPYASLCYYGGEGQYQLSDGRTDWRYEIEVKDSNDSVFICHLEGATSALNPMLSCADIDAKYIRVVKHRPTEPISVNLIIGATIENKVVEIAGITGGYINETLMPISIATSPRQDIDYFFHEEDIKPDSNTVGRNELRVSNTRTTIFEADKSYKIGHGEIIGLARLSMGLSQDNYSKFPLVVFCTDGVYTLSVDASGQYAYSSQDPLSRAVCTNANGICEIDGAVLFPTELGLQMVTSDGAKPVTIVANGKKINCPDKHAENGLALYNSAIHHQKVVEIASANSGEDFLAYIQESNTHISYLHALNSVIVYNGNHPYVYMIELSTWGVTKLELTVVCDDNDYPKQTFNSIGHGVLKPIQFNYDNPNDNTPVLLATRPIALESRQLKTIYRVVLRGAFENIGLLDKHICMLVYGSLDGNHWDYLNGMEKLLTNNRFHDIGVETHHVSYKYMMVVLVGELSKDSHIDGFEVTSIQKYNNKLK